MQKKHITFLFPDKLHFHARNFDSLFKFIDANRIHHEFVTEFEDWKSLYGNYHSKKDILSEDFQKYYYCTPRALLQESKYHINIFEIAKAELLCFALPLMNWRDEVIPNHDQFIVEKLWRENRELLCLNMAAAAFWLEYWERTLKKMRHVTHCCVFSGSAIYTKALLNLLKQTAIKAIVMESVFTGNDYYFEEKYEHIANNSDIKFDTVFNSIQLPKDFAGYAAEKLRASNKILGAKNKNVIQPSVFKHLKFPNKKPIITILGQVLNDFSIIETQLENINALVFYKKLITALLDKTEFTIVFKAHPWEQQKINLKSPLTYNELNQFRKSLSKKYQTRLTILLDYNIYSLFDQTDYLLTLCSQGALEGAFHGLKPFQLGKAFYGNKGFTYDYNTIDEFINDIANNSLSGTLSLEEFTQFETFITKLFQFHLISTSSAGQKTLETKIKSFQKLPPLLKNIQHKKQLSAFKRKLRKFLLSPYLFFDDCKYKALRPLKYFFITTKLRGNYRC